jgi:hypothetical protein
MDPWLWRVPGAVQWHQPGAFRPAGGSEERLMIKLPIWKRRRFSGMRIHLAVSLCASHVDYPGDAEPLRDVFQPPRDCAAA